MTICYHTFLRWENEVAVCAVCARKFEGYPYNASFKGTFPRDKYLEWKHTPKHWHTASYTTQINVPDVFYLGGDYEDDDSTD